MKTFLVVFLVTIAGCSHEMDGSEAVSHGHGSLDAAISLEHSDLVAGEPATLQFNIRDHHGVPLTNLMRHHARVVHLVIVGADLDSFGHIHPEDFIDITPEVKEQAVYPLEFTFPKAGRYMLALDIMNPDGSYSEQFIVNVDGEPGMDDVELNFSSEGTFATYFVGETDRYVDAISLDGVGKEYTVKFTPPTIIRAREQIKLSFVIEKDGEPVADLEPFLDAPMHLAIVKQGFEQFIHTHGSPSGVSMQDSHEAHVSKNFGPELEAHTIFPSAGTYIVVGQTKHKGEMIVFHFFVEVI